MVGTAAGTLENVSDCGQCNLGNLWLPCKNQNESHQVQIDVAAVLSKPKIGNTLYSKSSNSLHLQNRWKCQAQEVSISTPESRPCLASLLFVLGKLHTASQISNHHSPATGTSCLSKRRSKVLLDPTLSSGTDGARTRHLRKCVKSLDSLTYSKKTISWQ